MFYAMIWETPNSISSLGCVVRPISGKIGDGRSISPSLQVTHAHFACLKHCQSSIYDGSSPHLGSCSTPELWFKSWVLRFLRVFQIRSTEPSSPICDSATARSRCKSSPRKRAAKGFPKPRKPGTSRWVTWNQLPQSIFSTKQNGGIMECVYAYV